MTAGWHFVPPAVLVGFGHALLFPAVVSLGTETFPLKYRGTGSTLILGFFDLGMLACAPVLGGIVDYGAHHGLEDGAEFTPMFLLAAGLVCGVAVYYQRTAGRGADVDVLAEAEAREQIGTTSERHAKPQAASGRFEPIRGGVPEPAGAR